MYTGWESLTGSVLLLQQSRRDDRITGGPAGRCCSTSSAAPGAALTGSLGLAVRTPSGLTGSQSGGCRRVVRNQPTPPSVPGSGWHTRVGGGGEIAFRMDQDCLKMTLCCRGTTGRRKEWSGSRWGWAVFSEETWLLTGFHWAFALWRILSREMIHLFSKYVHQSRAGEGSNRQRDDLMINMTDISRAAGSWVTCGAASSSRTLLNPGRCGSGLRCGRLGRCAACYVATKGGESLLNTERAAREAEADVTFQLTITRQQVVAAMTTIFFEDD